MSNNKTIGLDYLSNSELKSRDEILKLYDQLDTADINFMIGQWRGTEIRTGNPMENILPLLSWYGKRFTDAENVHPLLFYAANGKDIVAINPSLMPLNLRVPKLKIIKYVFFCLQPFLKTNKSRARLRMVEYRGRLSAAMIYDQLPIIDHFRKIDEDRVLGVMDLKINSQPYFFLLTRES